MGIDPRGTSCYVSHTPFFFHIQLHFDNFGWVNEWVNLKVKKQNKTKQTNKKKTD